MTCTEQDQRLMRLAVDLASCGKRTVRSNPLVGCVIVNDGEVVGQGFHRRRGKPMLRFMRLIMPASERGVERRT